MELNLNVKSMTCKSCEKIIEETVGGLNGVSSVKADYPKEQVVVEFDESKINKDNIVGALDQAGYPLSGKTSLKQGLVYGLVPHIGCIGFIVASILGVTIAIEFFRPLLMNPWFFHILILLSIVFATISSVFYLKKNGVLSFSGVKRKKAYLATMYGATVGINLVLFLFIFPMLANIDTGSFATANVVNGVVDGTGAIALASETPIENTITLQVDIPCPGHAPLITNELKTIDGVTGVRFSFPNNFDVAFNEETSKQEILALEVFETYPAEVLEESINATQVSLSAEEVSSSDGSLRKVSSNSTSSSTSSTTSTGSCSSCGGSTCGGSRGGSCGCGAR